MLQVNEQTLQMTHIPGLQAVDAVVMEREDEGAADVAGLGVMHNLPDSALACNVSSSPSCCPCSLPGYEKFERKIFLWQNLSFLFIHLKGLNLNINAIPFQFSTPKMVKFVRNKQCSQQLLTTSKGPFRCHCRGDRKCFFVSVIKKLLEVILSSLMSIHLSKFPGYRKTAYAASLR